MSFGQNIQFLRKRHNMTQEALAAHMEVSRQTVSKWESDASYPETEKILQLCSLFSCSMDTLLRGDAENEAATDTTHYDKEQNSFTAAVSAGTALVLLGITLLLFLYGLRVHETLAVIVMFFFIMAAAVIFIVSGINHSAYVQKHPHIQPFYSEEQIERFNRKFPFLIAAPTALILLGMIWVMCYDLLAQPASLNPEQWDCLFVTPFMLAISIAAPVYISAGMLKSKYNIEEYNREHSDTSEKRQLEKRIGVWCSLIMLTAVIIFMLCGFIGNLWDTAWVVFAVGGVLCAIVSVWMRRKE